MMETQPEFITIASYKMSARGVSQTLYRPPLPPLPTQHKQPLSQPPQSSQHQHSHSIQALDAIHELQRTDTATTEHSLSSDIYLDPNHDYKLVLDFTPNEIVLVRKSWLDMISDDMSRSNQRQNSIASSLFCIQFYSNLLSMDSNLEKMFPSIKHQAVSFTGVLSTAIHNLESLEKLDDYLSNLGKRHSRILGIDPPHFELMGVALLKTFKDRYGEDFTLELERCWARLYTYLANSILQFGIDPVLRNEKINEEFNFGLSRSTTANSSSSTLASSLFDSSRMPMSSTVNTIPQAVARKQPSVSSFQRAPATPATPPPTSTKFGRKGLKKRTLSSSQEDGDEKCVIM